MLLHDMGFDVTLVGRIKKDSLPMPERPYRTKRMKLLFSKGVLFYLEFNFRLSLFLFFRKKHVLFANDLDTLIPNFFASKMSTSVLIYDSHELFCEVPELAHNSLKKRLWEIVEAAIVPRLKYTITVNQSIANWFNAKYHQQFTVIRNVSALPALQQLKSRSEIGLPENRKIILLQGAGINIQRGAEEAVEAMKNMEDELLLIIGGGDVFPQLKQLVQQFQLQDKVWLLGKKNQEELQHFTRNADMGISIDKDNNINYHYSLPNKLFDYIHAGIPVLASPLPEIKAIVEKYQIGLFIEHHDPQHIARQFKKLLYAPEYPVWKENTKKAANENNWEKEKVKLIALIQSAQQELKGF